MKGTRFGRLDFLSTRNKLVTRRRVDRCAIVGIHRDPSRIKSVEILVIRVAVED
jgi:hypothetical protein